MSTAPTAFPYPGENFLDRQGTLRGVTTVENVSDEHWANGVLKVSYIDGEDELYHPGERHQEAFRLKALELLNQYSEWLDSSGVQFNAGSGNRHDDPRTHQVLVREFIEQRNPQAWPRAVS